MTKKVQVSSIEITYPRGGSKKMSVDEARDLYRQLRELFGEKDPGSTIVIEKDRWPYWRSPYMMSSTAIQPNATMFSDAIKRSMAASASGTTVSLVAD